MHYGQRRGEARFLCVIFYIRPTYGTGGPLINRRGQAIGINTVIFTRAGGSTGIGLAIPTRAAEPILARLAAEGGRARTGSGALTVGDGLRIR